MITVVNRVGIEEVVRSRLMVDNRLRSSGLNPFLMYMLLAHVYAFGIDAVVLKIDGANDILYESSTDDSGFQNILLTAAIETISSFVRSRHGRKTEGCNVGPNENTCSATWSTVLSMSCDIRISRMRPISIYTHIND